MGSEVVDEESIGRPPWCRGPKKLQLGGLDEGLGLGVRVCVCRSGWPGLQWSFPLPCLTLAGGERD